MIATNTHINRSSVSRKFCSNCTCSPGLLSRQHRKNFLTKQISLSRSASSYSIKTPLLSRNNSTISLCQQQQQSSSMDHHLLSNQKEINTSKRLLSLRNEMKSHDLAIYIVPSEDEHQSEYVSSADQRRSFISGFTGSAGIAIITRDLLSMNETPSGLAALCTDGRYYIQANNELDFNWKLLKTDNQNNQSWELWTIKNAIQSSLDTYKEVNIGIDPKLFTFDRYDSFKKLIQNEVSKKLPETPKINLVPITENLIDKIWPEFEKKPIRLTSNFIKLNENISGKSTLDKIDQLKKTLKNDFNSSYFVITALDEIAWLLNLRASDIPYNPVFFSYMIITENSHYLYCDIDQRIPKNDKSNENILNYLNNDCQIITKPYNQFWSDLSTISEEISKNNSNNKFLIPNSSSWELVRNLKSDYLKIQSPIELLKSVKNKTEILGLKTAHKKDAIALIKFFSWLEDQLINKEKLLTEYDAAVKQKKFRKEMKNFIDLSFETISSTGKNASIIHYAPSEFDSLTIDPSKIYLNDSGAQFLEGTTDITRTIHFSNPSQEEIDNYTLVLKGNISLENIIFPEGTNGVQLDVLARQFLWAQGLDYQHGTGHGIGSFLNVHEGPVGVGYRPYYARFPLEVGNYISNEPGYYKDNEYGIRIENDMIVIKADDINKGLENNKKFLKFENVCLVPYCKKLINVKLLTEKEIEVINKRHNLIFKEVSHYLESNSIALNWLKIQCAPLKKK
ncbi:aminopeptidase P [Ascoidea rubescens DSM 1968]|uniref:Xaa-Pro aminopeptidase n=1 Tax=Ascoidea rubescens DSM 1968 TaxID=1344418 RepID=A0A1D2VHF4_9ASCO|nr:Creatinase/aminopeptidase [Ascoidea rubescens DSM 1968]ODV61084.1 Creatinase/aminopeptidase [Ascoidea rubescens DSM 1968]